MDIAGFHALSTGDALQIDGDPARLSLHDLGLLRVGSGRLAATDPIGWWDDPLVVEVEPGEYPVRVTLADVSEKLDGSLLKVAYLSVVLSDEAPASLRGAPVVGASEVALDGQPAIYGVLADEEVVSFCDASLTSRSDLDVDGWAGLVDDPEHLLDGVARVRLDGGEGPADVVLSRSGWGDGLFLLSMTVDAAGRPVAVHLDFEVVGDPGYPEDELDEFTMVDQMVGDLLAGCTDDEF